MGLGKTIQVLSLLLLQRRRSKGARQPSLLVAPASLLANWSAEIENSPRNLTHADRASLGDDGGAGEGSFTPEQAAELDLAITSYGSLLRMPGVGGDGLALRHPGRGAGDQESGRQADPRRQGVEGAGAYRADRHAGGEPPRRSVVDLRFHQSRPAGDRQNSSRATPRAWPTATDNPYGPLRELVRPYILRRMKTDKAIIADLPDKTEVKAHCGLSRKQAALYEQAVRGAGKRAGGGGRHRSARASCWRC